MLVFFLKDQLDILVISLIRIRIIYQFSFNMKENECKKEAPPPYLLLSINGAENRHTMKIKPDVGGSDLHTNIIFGASLIKNEVEVGVLENFTVIAQLPRNKPVT